MSRASFRTRLLLALLGCIALLVGLTMLVVHLETARQLGQFEQRTLARAGEASGQLEKLWHDQLADAALRLGTSRRVQAAAAEGDPGNLRDVVIDERSVAAIPDALVIIADPDGLPLTVLGDGETAVSAGAVSLEPWLARLIAAEERVFGYEVVDGRLFVVHATVLSLFHQPLGILLVGFPVVDDDAGRLAEVIDAEICFVVDGACVAATAAVRGTRLESLLVQSAGRLGWTSDGRGSSRWAIIAQPLSPGAEHEATRAVAVPLHPVLAPFERIRRVTSLVGLVATLLAGVLALVLSRGLTRPVERLVAATRRIADGEYDVKVPVESGDEIGVLGAAFNGMAEGLLLKERYRGVLDKVVSPEIAHELLKGEIRLGGETREVTTLFADIRGFTARTEGMEPQEVIRLLNDYLGRATAAVEAEGGVVDKYVGDEVIALFGAPVARPDDPIRAVRAAVSIQTAMQQLNAERARRGEPATEVGIGINTGPSVAGNMGSARRMNYTVVGEAVNLTARLCSAAAPGEILISASTWLRVCDRIAARRRPPIRLKGFSEPVTVYSVEMPPQEQTPVRDAANGEAAATAAAASDGGARDAAGTPPGASPGVSPGASTGIAGLAALVAVVGGTAPLSAQQQTGLSTFDFRLLGRVEVEGYLPQDAPAWIIESTDPFVAGRASLFGIATYGDRLSALVEARADRGQIPADRSIEVRIQQAFAHYALGTELGLAVQAGKFVSPMGMYAQRHRTPADPFIRPPLAHEHRTTVSATATPAAVDGFLGWKDEPLATRRRGAPLLWGVPYPTGAALDSRFRGADLRLAVVNSAPSSAPREWAPDFSRPLTASLVANAGYQLRPELRLGVSYATGPYLEAILEDSLPEGRGLRDFVQQTWNVNLAFSRGRMEAHAELFANRWDVPNLMDSPRDLAYYLEGKLKLVPGAYLATRYNGIRFNDLSRSSGAREPWDHDVHRLQFAGGYRLTQNSELRAEYMLNRSAAPRDAANNLFALQLWWAF